MRSTCETCCEMRTPVGAFAGSAGSVGRGWIRRERALEVAGSVADVAAFEQFLAVIRDDDDEGSTWRSTTWIPAKPWPLLAKT